MAISLPYTANDSEIPSGANFMANFNQVINNPVDLWSPAGKAADMNGNELVMDADGDSSLTEDTDDRLDVRLSGTDLFRFDGTAATPVNGLNFIAGATGTRAVIDAGITGADANVGLTLLANGTGPIVIDNDTDPVALRINGAAGGADNNVIQDTNGNELLTLRATASAVNHLRVTNVATGSTPSLTADGDDTDISLNLVSKGAGTIQANGSQVSTLLAASQAQMETGSSNAVAVTPGVAQYHASAAKCWAQAGTTGNIISSYNMASITDTGTGQATFVIATDFSSANFCPVACMQAGAAYYTGINSTAAGTVRVDVFTDAGAAVDPTYFFMAAFGDQ